MTKDLLTQLSNALAANPLSKDDLLRVYQALFDQFRTADALNREKFSASFVAMVDGLFSLADIPSRRLIVLIWKMLDIELATSRSSSTSWALWSEHCRTVSKFSNGFHVGACVSYFLSQRHKSLDICLFMCSYVAHVNSRQRLPFPESTQLLIAFHQCLDVLGTVGEAASKSVPYRIWDYAQGRFVRDMFRLVLFQDLFDSATDIPELLLPKYAKAFEAYVKGYEGVISSIFMECFKAVVKLIVKRDALPEFQSLFRSICARIHGQPEESTKVSIYDMLTVMFCKSKWSPKTLVLAFVDVFKVLLFVASDESSPSALIFKLIQICSFSASIPLEALDNVDFDELEPLFARILMEGFAGYLTSDNTDSQFEDVLRLLIRCPFDQRYTQTISSPLYLALFEPMALDALFSVTAGSSSKKHATILSKLLTTHSNWRLKARVEFHLPPRLISYLHSALSSDLFPESSVIIVLRMVKSFEFDGRAFQEMMDSSPVPLSVLFKRIWLTSNASSTAPPPSSDMFRVLASLTCFAYKDTRFLDLDLFSLAIRYFCSNNDYWDRDYTCKDATISQCLQSQLLATFKNMQISELCRFMYKLTSGLDRFQVYKSGSAESRFEKYVLPLFHEKLKMSISPIEGDLLLVYSSSWSFNCDPPCNLKNEIEAILFHNLDNKLAWLTIYNLLKDFSPLFILSTPAYIEEPLPIDIISDEDEHFITVCTLSEERRVESSLLTSISPAFASMLSAPFKESHQSLIKLPNIKPATFDTFLHWSFTRNLPTTTTTELMMDLYDFCDLYLVDELRYLCLRSILTSPNDFDHYSMLKWTLVSPDLADIRADLESLAFYCCHRVIFLKICSVGYLEGINLSHLATVALNFLSQDNSGSPRRKRIKTE